MNADDDGPSIDDLFDRITALDTAMDERFRAVHTDMERMSASLTSLQADVLEVQAHIAAGRQEENADPPAQPPHLHAPRFPHETYYQELGRLQEWVTHYLERFVVHVSPAQPWCLQWHEHFDAVGILHSLWLAWQELIDTSRAGPTGPSVWFRDHFTPHMNYLRSPHGPFAACMRSLDRVEHRLPDPVRTQEQV